MKEPAVDEHDAERVGPSWYLCRDGAQHGPLSERELALFAEGGNFKADDLLWTAGLDGWKPAEAIFGLASMSEVLEPAAEAEIPAGDETPLIKTDPAEADASAEATDVRSLVSAPDVSSEAEDDPHHLVEPSGEDVDALVQVLKGEAPPRSYSLKERAMDELKRFAGTFVYLWVVFTVLLLHEWIVLADHHIGFAFYGLATLNALALGKIMVLAEQFNFGERLKQKPLIYPIVYKTVAFTTLLFVAYTLEMMLLGFLGGHGFLASMPALGGSMLGTMMLWVVFCAALIPYFAFKEFERAVGPDIVRKLLLGGR
jgi:hypothetical protein